MKITKDDIGARVYSPRFGWGNIASIKEANSFSVTVNFERDDIEETYTEYGTSVVCASSTELFWQIPEEPPRPKRKVKREGWVNVYPSMCESGRKPGGQIFDIEEEAEKAYIGDSKIATVKIEWEEEI